jgi:hypothetical protein
LAAATVTRRLFSWTILPRGRRTAFNSPATATGLILKAVEGAFGGDIDYAMLVKLYGPSPEGARRYSPAECIGSYKQRVEGDPDPNHVRRPMQNGVT